MFALLKQSDARAVRQVLRGRRDQFDTLVERYLPAVYAVSYAQLRNHADAEDVAQEAFLTAFTSLHTLREPHKFEGWVVSMARRIAVHLRQKRQHENDVNGLDAGEAVVLPDVARDELRQLLRQEIDRLEDDEREVLLLHYFTGKSTGEVAAALDIGREAAKKRLQRARQQLSENLLRIIEEEAKPAQDFKKQRNVIAGLILVAAIPWENAVAGANVPAPASSGVVKIVVLALTVLAAVGVHRALSSIPITAKEPSLVSVTKIPAQSQESVASAIVTPASAAGVPISDNSESVASPDNGTLDASLSGLWNACDNLGMLSSMNILQVVHSGKDITISAFQNGSVVRVIASGTVEEDTLVVSVGGSKLTGTLTDGDAFEIAGEFKMEGKSTDLNIAFARLNDRDLAEVEIQNRRTAEVVQLAGAIHSYANAHDGAKPASLAQLDSQYLPVPQLAESTPSRIVTYMRGGIASADEGTNSDIRNVQERLLKREVERREEWPSFPAAPSELAIQYSAPPMTLVCLHVEQPGVLRIDTNSSLACKQVKRGPTESDDILQDSCSMNMKQLGLVLKMFENESPERRFPGGWATTIPEYLTDTMILTCPSLGEKDEPGRTVSYEILFPAQNEKELEEMAAELGVAAGNAAGMLSEIPIAIECHSCAGNSGSHALFVDGHVELLDAAAWQARITPFVEYSERYYADL